LRRQHRLLMSVCLVFSITWLPLNVLNLTLDLYNPFKLPRDKEMMLIIYAACHLFGMTSACANPFLYGWFNENFRNEFKIIFGAPFRLLCPDGAAGDDNHRRRSSASAFPSAADTRSTLGESIRLMRVPSAPPMIYTNNMKKNSIINTRGLGQPLSTVKEMSETSDDHKHEVETNKLLSQLDCSQAAKGGIKTKSNDECQAHSLFEMDNTIMMLYPISSSTVESSSILETHL